LGFLAGSLPISLFFFFFFFEYKLHPSIGAVGRHNAIELTFNEIAYLLDCREICGVQENIQK